jgi:hypothetical protein
MRKGNKVLLRYVDPFSLNRDLLKEQVGINRLASKARLGSEGVKL